MIGLPIIWRLRTLAFAALALAVFGAIECIHTIISNLVAGTQTRKLQSCKWCLPLVLLCRWYPSLHEVCLWSVTGQLWQVSQLSWSKGRQLAAGGTGVLQGLTRMQGPSWKYSSKISNKIFTTLCIIFSSKVELFTSYEPSFLHRTNGLKHEAHDQNPSWPNVMVAKSNTPFSLKSVGKRGDSRAER